MHPTETQIALAFSGGSFIVTYPHLAEEIHWNIVGDRLIQGRGNLITFCDQTAKYFSEVTTVFNMANLIVGDTCVAIDGTAEFTNKENKKTFISSCDVY
jgi:hypothetical protein